VVNEIEPPARRLRPDSGTETRTALLVVRVRPTSLVVIDVYAQRNGWTRADAVRALLRVGLKAEGASE
jgi:hypothetical protein